MEAKQEYAVATTLDYSALEQVLIGGDLSKLPPAQRVQYYQKVCESIGLNPLTKPFDYITLNGKMTLYAKKDATDQLRKINTVSIDDVDLKETADSFIVKVKGHDSTGRSDVEIGVVKKTDMQGNAGNAQMKAVTKAKRRLTLSLCGLGWLDETEIETIPSAKPVKVDNVTGEIDPVFEGEVTAETVDKPVNNKPATNHVQPANGKMSREMAETMADSKGKLFKDMTKSDLAFHANKYEKRKKDTTLTPDQHTENLLKLDAAKFYMATPTA